jgi:hypothetical protein
VHTHVVIVADRRPVNIRHLADIAQVADVLHHGMADSEAMTDTATGTNTAIDTASATASAAATGPRTWGPVSGVAGAALYAVSAFTAGSPLKPDASLQNVISHLTTSRGALLAGVVLNLVATALLLCFLAYLVCFVAEAEGGRGPLSMLTLGSGVGVLAIVTGGQIPLDVVTWSGPAHFDPTVTRLAFDMANLSLYSISAVVVAVLVLTPTVVVWRSGALPRWLLAVAALEITINAVELGGLFGRAGADAGGYAEGLGPFVWLIWVAAVSLCLMRRGSAGSARSEHPGSLKDPETPLQTRRQVGHRH